MGIFKSTYDAAIGHDCCIQVAIELPNYCEGSLCIRDLDQDCKGVSITNLETGEVSHDNACMTLDQIEVHYHYIPSTVKCNCL